LSGLAAAVDLVDQGFEVIVVEAADQCGGKLAAWRDEEGDAIEHGIHGWWPNYVNLLHLMAHVGIPAHALNVAAGSVGVLPDGLTFDMKPLQIRVPAPWFLWPHFRRSPVRGLVDLLSLVRAGIGVLSFDAERDYDGLDRYTFRSWLWRRGVSRRIYETFFEPYVRSFAFDSAARTSAAAVLSSLHLYLVRHQDDILARWLVDEPQSLVIDPIVNYIHDHGGTVVTGVRAEDLAIDNASGSLTGVQISRPVGGLTRREPAGATGLTRVPEADVPDKGYLALSDEHGSQFWLGRADGRILAFRDRPSSAEGSPPPSARHELAPPPDAEPLIVEHAGSEVVLREFGPEHEVRRVPLSEIPADGFLSLEKGTVLVGWHARRLVALSAFCTHMGCRVVWNEVLGVFRCPCHSASFRGDGTGATTPAERPLAQYATRIQGDEVVIFEPPATNIVLEGDRFIVAVDVASFQKLLPHRLRGRDMLRRIDYLGTTPVVVVRLWFPGASLLGDKTSGLFVNFPLLDNFFVVSNLHASFAGRSETVIEVQAYMVDDTIDLPDPALLEAVLADLRSAFPGLPLPRKHRILRHPSVFTHHAAGSDQHRPDTRTPVPNLYLAGDWVGQSPEVWNMERAAVTGRLAATAIIEDVGGIGPLPVRAEAPGATFRASVAVAQWLNNAWRAFRRFRTGDPRRPPRPSTPPRRWRSSVQFAAVKFPGEPNEQVVKGRFSDVTGKAVVTIDGGVLDMTGEFRVGLESFDSGHPLRNYNVRKAVFDTARHAYAIFRLLHVRSAVMTILERLAGYETEMDCSGELILNDVMLPIAFPVTARFTDELVTVRPTRDIVIQAHDFGLSVASLTPLCRARVADEVRITFRAAIPYSTALTARGTSGP
jgi:uncharacterized protein with NAD-binding domain and iron-sulfur cluster/Rieske Fe-S protein